jgi:hypothetical protein
MQIWSVLWKKKVIEDSFLESIVGNNRLYEWKSLPFSVGGILVGVDLDFYDIICWDVRDFSVSVIVKLKMNGTIVRVTMAYGSSYEDKKEVFLSELHIFFLNYQGHSLIGGDFNIAE